MPLVPLAGRGAHRQPLTIFLSDQASPSERWAAQELASHLEQITGSRLPVISGGAVPPSRRAIAVGQSALTEACGVVVPEGEACLLKTDGETIIIAGGRQRGTMYGVSIFLEKLGCRWFTHDIARIPHSGSLRLPRGNEIHRPAFDYREVFFTEAQGGEWSTRNRLNGHFHKLDKSVGGKIVYMPFAHAFDELVPPAEWFDTHPEYFALVSGTRRRQHAQLCLTNPAVVRLAVAQARQWLTAHPEVSIVSLSQNDGGGWCECEPCRQVIREEGGAISGLALRFVNQVAAQLDVSHPGKTADMLAYQQTADPPLTARPLANVQIRLCPIDACQGHSYLSCDYNRRFRARLEQWSRIAPRLHVWQYSINFAHYLLPFPNYDSLISDIPAFHRAGVKGMFVEGAVSDGGGGDDAELRSFLAARLLWNPALDAEKEIRDFTDAVYGPAAPFMQTWFELRQQQVRRGAHVWCDQNVDAGYLTPSLLKNGRTLLESASRRAATDPARKRIDRHLLSLDYVEAIRAKRCVVRGDAYGPADPVRASNATRTLVGEALALRVTNLREGYPIKEQVRDWGEVGRRYAVLSLPGEAHAQMSPELGRVIALGRPNILRVPDPGELRYPDVGGIHVSLSEGKIAWKPGPNGALIARSEAGCDLRMNIGVDREVLRVEVTVVNSTNSPAQVAIQCRAEFACGLAGQATLRYRDCEIALRNREDGSKVLTGDELPAGEWAIYSGSPGLLVRNRFRMSDAGHARAAYDWSGRGESGLNVGMSVASRDLELAPGQQLTLESEYQSRDEKER